MRLLLSGVGLMKLTTKGQVTIPLNIREQLGLLPWTEVTFDVVDDSVRIRKAATANQRGRRVIEQCAGRQNPGAA
jgi:AbrB family looped-hinge helix DNA binding protein